jgi:hypothetical protein
MANSQPPDTNLTAMLFRNSGCLPILGVVLVTVGASSAMHCVAQCLHINAAYGSAAWDGGLRVIDNKGHLSNGESLSGWGQFFVFGGSFLMTAPFFLGSAFGFAYLRMKLRGERLIEQLARWRSENQR